MVDLRTSLARLNRWARHPHHLPWLIGGGGLLLAVLLVSLRPRPEPVPPTPPPPPVVTVVAAEPQTRTLTVLSQGTVTPTREIDLVSEVGGRIESVAANFAEGAFVAAGTPLVQVEDADYRYALAQAEARVAQAREQLATERGRARQAKREWRDLGNPEANALFLREPQLANAEAQLRAAEAERDQARLDLERTTLRAPYDARIREKYVDLGQYLTPGSAVAQLFATERVQVRLPLTDRQVALVDLPLGFAGTAADSPGPAVTLTATFGGAEHQWQGRIVRTDASIDPQSRVLYAVAEVTAPYAAPETDSERPPRPPLAVGLFVEAAITGRTLDAVVALPKEALVRGDVLTVDADNRLRFTPVTVLQRHNGTVWVRGDLAAGTPVVISPLPFPVPGMAVQPEPATTAAQAEPAPEPATEAPAP